MTLLSPCMYFARFCFSRFISLLPPEASLRYQIIITDDAFDEARRPSRRAQGLNDSFCPAQCFDLLGIFLQALAEDDAHVSGTDCSATHCKKAPILRPASEVSLQRADRNRILVMAEEEKK